MPDIFKDFKASDWMTLIQTSTQVLGLMGIILVVVQIKKTDYWNKLQQSINTIWTTRLPDLKTKLQEFEGKGYLKLDDAVLSDDQLKMCYADPDAKHAILNYLNNLEETAGAYLLNAFDDNYAYAMWYTTIIGYYRYFEKFINQYRIDCGDMEIFADLEYVALKWEQRMKREKATSAHWYDIILNRDRYRRRKLLAANRKK
jgi:Domain of unknown function (DUF4760)